MDNNLVRRVLAVEGEPLLHLTVHVQHLRQEPPGFIGRRGVRVVADLLLASERLARKRLQPLAQLLVRWTVPAAKAGMHKYEEETTCSLDELYRCLQRVLRGRS
eukprot:1480247-Prymnesium_polylepis.1